MPVMVEVPELGNFKLALPSGWETEFSSPDWSMVCKQYPEYCRATLGNPVSPSGFIWAVAGFLEAHGVRGRTALKWVQRFSFLPSPEGLVFGERHMDMNKPTDLDKHKVNKKHEQLDEQGVPAGTYICEPYEQLLAQLLRTPVFLFKMMHDGAVLLPIHKDKIALHRKLAKQLEEARETLVRLEELNQ